MRARSVLAASMAIAAVATYWTVPDARAQAAPAVKRTVLQKHALRAPEQEGVMATAEIPPGAREGRHTHPAEGFAYVLEGTLTFKIDGQPAATYRAGDHFFIEPGVVHEGLNEGTVPVKVLVVFVSDKGKPVTSPVN